MNTADIRREKRKAWIRRVQTAEGLVTTGGEIATPSRFQEILCVLVGAGVVEVVIGAPKRSMRKSSLCNFLTGMAGGI